MIDRIRLKSGSTEGEPHLEFDVTPITIFVGPNNSGKSRVLIELENFCRQTRGQMHDLVLDSLLFSGLKEEEIKREITKIEDTPKIGSIVEPGYIVIPLNSIYSEQQGTIQVHKQNLIDEAQTPNSRQGYYGMFLNLYTIRLDGVDRLNLLKEQFAGDLQKSPSNHLTRLFADNDLRKEVRRIIYDAFRKYYVIDPTNIGKLRVRLSDREPNSEGEERGWGTESVDYHNASIEIKYASDGVKAFSGIITILLAGDPKIILIDEPEAFLHPALSNQLGTEIGKSLRATRKRLFVSTHSSSFLMGCIQSGTPLNVVRLTYKDGIATSRILSKEKILKLMRNPLLRSTGVLNGLFYESVVVSEADSDRAFYEEINERLLAANDSRGISSCLFINAQNKQTVWEIVRPLRELGIPAIGIVDIDVLKDGGEVFSKPLNGAFIPKPTHEAFHIQRQTYKSAFEASGKNMKKDGGIQILDPPTQEACDSFFSNLDIYGVFIVRNGELESWLEGHGAVGHGSKWLINIFEKMGEDPESPEYTKPTSGDVWDFIGKIKGWIDNSNRKGIPK